ncbi:4-oxalocrotonate tautomerase [Rhizobium sp. CG5]|uniref:tautomerase family protein n=1 Tax=Rhizobium sp. CG5 TaxID=2726076 RepID=UPI002033253B|nr:tautomerase family protein [Rhizobium sp. CG5]MCM2473018.1 4-oxalocrotonate tautomerase [Rhizobium sp. CG5]
MPFVHIQVAAPDITQPQLRHLQSEVTRLMAEILEKRKELTAVRIERVDPGQWTVGDQPMTVAAHIDAKVRAGTNTQAQKAAFIAAAADLLRQVLGVELSPATYVVIHEVPGDAWGYDGRTQESRHLAD